MKKDEIRHDPIRENIINGIEYLRHHQSIVLKIFAAFAILIAFFSYYKNIGSEKIKNASTIAGLAQNTFTNGSIDEAMVKFERVLDDYPATEGATQALVYLLNDALSQDDNEAVINYISQYNKGIDSIGDPIIKSSIYKIQGDMALAEGNIDSAMSYYQKAEKSTKGTANKIKYQLDVVSILLIHNKFTEAHKKLKGILDFDEVGFNEKNKAEELLAFVNYKLGT